MDADNCVFSLNGIVFCNRLLHVYRHNNAYSNNNHESIENNQIGTKVYIGNLGSNYGNDLKNQIENILSPYGTLQTHRSRKGTYRVWMAYKPPGFAYVHFCNRSDAEKAVSELNKKVIINGQNIVLHIEEPEKKALNKSKAILKHVNKNRNAKLYVGNLGTSYNDTIKRNLEATFSKYGKLKKVYPKTGPPYTVWLARNPPGFAFIEFESIDDAEKALSSMNGIMWNGRKLKVEFESGHPNGKKSNGASQNLELPIETTSNESSYNEALIPNVSPNNAYGDVNKNSIFLKSQSPKSFQTNISSISPWHENRKVLMDDSREETPPRWFTIVNEDEEMQRQYMQLCK